MAEKNSKLLTSRRYNDNILYIMISKGVLRKIRDIAVGRLSATGLNDIV